MNTKKIPVPQNSLIFSYLPATYSDSYECDFISSKEISTDDIVIALWTTWPEWFKSLFKLRGILVKPFKVKSNINDIIEAIKDCINGKTMKYLSVPSKSNNETVLCGSEKHLTFYLSAMTQEKTGGIKSITITTLVNCHNLPGYCYFYIIAPFHKIIIRVLLNNLTKRIENTGQPF